MTTGTNRRLVMLWTADYPKASARGGNVLCPPLLAWCMRRYGQRSHLPPPPRFPQADPDA